MKTMSFHGARGICTLAKNVDGSYRVTTEIKALRFAGDADAIRYAVACAHGSQVEDDEETEHEPSTQLTGTH